MPLDLTKRSEVGSPITAAQNDQNMTDIEDSVNALEDQLAVSLDTDGTLKDGAVDNAAAIADGIITLDKFASLVETNAVIATDASGDFTAIEGTNGQILRKNDSTGVVEFVDASTVIPAASVGIWLNDNPSIAIQQTSTQSSWQTLDLTAFIAAASATDPDTVVIQVETFTDGTNAVSTTASSVLMRITSDSGTDTASENTHRSYSYGERGDGRVSVSNTTQMTVRLDNDTNIYWNTTFTNTGGNAYARIWVVGFMKLNA